MIYFINSVIFHALLVIKMETRKIIIAPNKKKQENKFKLELNNYLIVIMNAKIIII